MVMLTVGGNMGKNMDREKCLICERNISDPCSYHHLVPKEVGGKNSNQILLHEICHTRIHTIFTNRELKRYYHTVDRILEHEEMQKFVKWVRKFPPEYYTKNKQTNERRNKRRR